MSKKAEKVRGKKFLNVYYKENRPWLNLSLKMTEQRCLSQYSKSNTINNTFT